MSHNPAFVVGWLGWFCLLLLVSIIVGGMGRDYFVFFILGSLVLALVIEEVVLRKLGLF